MFESVGGIQNYSKNLLRELSEILPQAPHTVVLKNDVSVPKEAQSVRNIHYSCWGGMPHRLHTPAFSLRLLSTPLFSAAPLVVCGHVHFLPIALALKRLFSIPYWVVCFGVESWNISRPGLIQALINADQIISISRFTQQRIIEQADVQEEQCSILPCSFDDSRFSILSDQNALRKRYGFTSEEKILLSVNRLEAKEEFKAYDQVLRALPQIQNEIPNIRYVIVGHGSDQPRLEIEVKRLGLSGTVSVAGYVSDEELLHYYNICDLFVLPSKLEGFGIVFLEAMACGKAVVAGNQDGSKEAVRDGKYGLLVDPDDINELADVVVRYLKGTQQNSLLYDPEALRAGVYKHFGSTVFRSRLRGIVERSPLQHLLSEQPVKDTGGEV